MESIEDKLMNENDAQGVEHFIDEILANALDESNSSLTVSTGTDMYQRTTAESTPTTYLGTHQDDLT